MERNAFTFKFLNRKHSMFSSDLKKRHEELSAAILGKKMLVIGGAGTIGSSFIKAASLFHPKKIVVIDINEMQAVTNSDAKTCCLILSHDPLAI